MVLVEGRKRLSRRTFTLHYRSHQTLHAKTGEACRYCASRLAASPVPSSKACRQNCHQLRVTVEMACFDLLEYGSPFSTLNWPGSSGTNNLLLRSYRESYRGLRGLNDSGRIHFLHEFFEKNFQHIHAWRSEGPVKWRHHSPFPLARSDAHGYSQRDVRARRSDAFLQ
jgi:hypothetical protein